MNQDVSAQQRASGSNGNALISSDRVEGTKVFDAAGQHIGTIASLRIDKVSGRTAYAMVSFGGFLGLGAHEYAVPWGKLDYDTELRGYRTDLSKDQLEGAPSFYRASAGGVGTGRRPSSTESTASSAPDSDRDTDDYDWSDRSAERELHDYYVVGYYWED